MARIGRIIAAIDQFLNRSHQITTTPVEVNPHLEKIGLLNDSSSRPGLPLRNILRDGKIPHAYQDGVNWHIPHSGRNSRDLKPIHTQNPAIETKLEKTISTEGHKLSPIANLILNYIKNKYKETPTCTYEYKADWLLSYPTKELIEKHPELSELYSDLIDSKFSLEEKLAELTDKKLKQKQSFDIWIGEPFNFAIEFDEKQHFNQYRKITLDYYDKIDIRFPIEYYKKLNDEVEIKPGKSGFTRLNSDDPLFPEMLDGEKQDNRIRQRAFRDYLKDLLPVENGFKPTLRIPYHVTNKIITDFTDTEIRKVGKYIIDYKLI